MNNIIISGRLTADPEFNAVNGDSVCNIKICHNYYNGKDKADTPMFIELAFWKEAADNIQRKGLVKGQEIAILGQLYFDGKAKFPKLTIKYPKFLHIVAPYKSEPASGQSVNVPVADNDVPF